jgi:DNA-binding transcriptional MerR regulator
METIRFESTPAPTGVRLDKDYGADLEVLMSLVPEKMAFKIGEISEMLGLKNHILRYWESEFKGLKPKKSSHNQRMYTHREIELLLVIRKFLYVDKFSVSGARKALRQWQKEKNQKKTLTLTGKFDEIKTELESLITEIKDFRSLFENQI